MDWWLVKVIIKFKHIRWNECHSYIWYFYGILVKVNIIYELWGKKSKILKRDTLEPRKNGSVEHLQISLVDAYKIS